MASWPSNTSRWWANRRRSRSMTRRTHQRRSHPWPHRFPRGATLVQTAGRQGH